MGSYQYSPYPSSRSLNPHADAGSSYRAASPSPVPGQLFSPAMSSPYGQPYTPYRSQPPPPQQQQQQQAPSMYSRPSYSNHGHEDHDNWDAKSYASSQYPLTTHPKPEAGYGVGEVVPVPLLPQSYPPPQNPYGYPSPVPSRQNSNGYQNTWNGGGQRWIDMRDQMLKRRVIKQIPLHQGNLILDIPVPRHVQPPDSQRAAGVQKDEMSEMRYSAATCDPDDFMRNRFTLRPFLYGRKTELFIVLTMYNENEILFLRTLNACIKNIAHLCTRSRSKTWGTDAWQKVVVCVVSDGRKVINPRTLKVLQLMGVYSEGVAKDTVAGKEVHAHVFEYTSQVVVAENGEVGFGSVPVQILFCLKEKNKKKISSHRWFFNAFGPLLKPNVCVLLDVGTKPSGTSIYELYKCFERHQNVGGACGEIYADTGKWGKLLLNPLVAAQNFEYKISNILDKPLESVVGLISVLPGAFSAYRFAALANHSDGTGPLASYFHGEKMNEPGQTASVSQRNMFLAEDRILALEIVLKRGAKWRLKYVKSAKAGTDVPDNVPEFISQRRRWLNGSNFAAFHSLVSFWRIWTSGHNIFRMILLQLFMVYNLIQVLFNWFSLSSFYLAFFFLIDSFIKGSEDPFGGAGDEIFAVFTKVYIGLIFCVVVCSLGNRPQGSKLFYTACIVLFAICQGLLLYCAGWTVYQTVPKTVAGWTDVQALFNNKTFRDLALSLLATYGLYLIASCLYMEPFHMLHSFVQYLLLLPTYVNVLLIYAFCNLHDLGWGTKGDNGASKDLGQATKVSKDGKDILEVALPMEKDDVEELWQQARAELRQPYKEVHEKRSAETKRTDDDRNFRTNTVLLFLGSNLLVIMLFTSSVFTNFISSHFAESTTTTFNPYLTAIFWAVLGLSAVRFVGCVLYLLLRLIGF